MQHAFSHVPIPMVPNVRSVAAKYFRTLTRSKAKYRQKSRALAVQYTSIAWIRPSQTLEQSSHSIIEPLRRAGVPELACSAPPRLECG